MPDSRKEKLLQALIDERARLLNSRGASTEHDAAIEYLQTGKTDVSPDDDEMLYAVMEDFDCICSDYGIE
jgi:hypothetical protein